MVNKLDRINVVIDKIVRDLGLGHNEIPYADFIEWIAEALVHIGSYQQFVEKETMIVIENYEGRFPCDLYKVKRLKRGTETPRCSDGGYWGGTFQNFLIRNGLDVDELNAYDRHITLNDPGLRKVHGNNPFDVLNNKLQHNSNLGHFKTNNVTNLDYNINFDKITTAFESGIIEVQYIAMPIDEDGFPLIPDDQSFRDALFWKVAMQLCMRDPDLFKNPQLKNYDYVRSRWNFYCSQARASANMPDIHAMERLKNNFLSLIPRYNADLNNYAELGKPQFVNFDRR